MNGAPVTVHIGRQRLTGMFFLPGPAPLPAWIKESAPSALSGNTNIASYITTDDVTRDDAIRQALLDVIGHAKHKILFCSFLFADPPIVDALVDAAERLQGGVYVLTALDKSLQIDAAELGDEPVDPKAQRAEQRKRDRRDLHFEHLQRMAQAGVWLRSARDGHAKLCVVDDEVAVVTSANATPEAYERNPENGVIVRDPPVARELGRFLAHAWLHLADQESPPGATLDLKEIRRSTSPRWSRLEGRDPFVPIGTLRRADTSLRDATIKLIRGAHQELIITSYSAVALREHAVGKALREAIDDGVRVLLVLQPRNLHPDQPDTCGFLMDGIPEEQVSICGHRFNHAKAIVADGSRALIWTGNLDGSAGYDDGIEIGLTVTDRGIVAAVREHILAIARRATHRGVLRPTLRDVALVERRRLDGAWTLVLPHKTPPGPAVLAQKLGQSIVAYAEPSPGLLVLRAGDVEISVRVDEERRQLTAERVLNSPPSSTRVSGLVGDCILTIIEESAPATAPRRGSAPRKRNGERR